MEKFDLEKYITAYVAQQNRTSPNCGECFREGFNKAKAVLLAEVLAEFEASPNCYYCLRTIKRIITKLGARK